MMGNSSQKILLTLLLILFSGILGYNLGKNEVAFSWKHYKPNITINSKEPPVTIYGADFSLFWDVWERTVRNYYDKKAIDPQKMRDGAISGMLGSLGDPYTMFLNPTQNSETKKELRGEFEGIGAQLGLKDKRIIVVAPLKDTPAEKAGIKAGDFVLKIDGKDTTGLTLPDAVQKIRGPKGTKVMLTILHDKETEPLDVVVSRDTITVQSVEGWVKKAAEVEGIKGMEGKDGKVGYIRLTQFGDNTNNQWTLVVSRIRKELDLDPSIRGVILDLRNNPGGYLNGAVFIGSEFIESGPIVLQEKDSVRQVLSVDRKGLLTKTPLVVLINKGSASASEIVAGALRDHKRAKLVGETSFGKGTVQEAIDIGQNAGLHLTTAKWLTPNGIWVHEKGLTPDIEAPLDKNDPSHDTQLEKAVATLLQ